MLLYWLVYAKGKEILDSATNQNRLFSKYVFYKPTLLAIVDYGWTFHFSHVHYSACQFQLPESIMVDEKRIFVLANEDRKQC